MTTYLAVGLFVVALGLYAASRLLRTTHGHGQRHGRSAPSAGRAPRIESRPRRPDFSEDTAPAVLSRPEEWRS